MLERLEHVLHPWTSFAVIPIFALANAGIELGSGAIVDAASSRVSLGVAAGLVIGKPMGILLFAWAAVRGGVGTLPAGVRWAELTGAAMVAGIGFTVSIFITELAFEDAALVDEAKIAVLAGSAVSAIAGFTVLRIKSRGATGEIEEASL
jgi:Na+/H+ antiporter NhaA